MLNLPQNAVFKRLNSDKKIKPFDCGNKKINSFLFNKAVFYHKFNYAVTYLIETTDKTIAFFTLLNNSCKLELDKKFWKQRVKSSPFLYDLIKYSTFPAVELAYIGVTSD